MGIAMYEPNSGFDASKFPTVTISDLPSLLISVISKSNIGANWAKVGNAVATSLPPSFTYILLSWVVVFSVIAVLSCSSEKIFCIVWFLYLLYSRYFFFKYGIWLIRSCLNVRAVSYTHLKMQCRIVLGFEIQKLFCWFCT